MDIWEPPERFRELFAQSGKVLREVKHLADECSPSPTDNTMYTSLYSFVSIGLWTGKLVGLVTLPQA